MAADWKSALERWLGAGLLDAAAAERIRAFEAQREKPQSFRWQVRLALAFGGLLLAAGILLFVAAHWDELSSLGRFSVVLAMVAVLHLGGAVMAQRFSTLATVLHAVGTAALGAAIFLSGQIFNLEEHWPGGFMLWAAGAWLGWMLFRDWPHAAMAAVLTPIWLFAEWAVATERMIGAQRIILQGELLLAIVYFTAAGKEKVGAVQKALIWIGGIALIPAVFAATGNWYSWGRTAQASAGLLALGWALAYALPLALALFLRRRGARQAVLAAGWVLVLGVWPERWEALGSGLVYFWHQLGIYLWCLLGSVGMVAWGLYEEREERINLGVAGFAITVITFYFASVMDKLGRANTLMGLGVMFLVGGWFLERTRRRLVARLDRGAS
ncbi:MAG: DUF2157 domain-containing protein [Acidobacteria bacterium]|nr:DUF2157 domain-containing protein [Acidobacteriota bacterium]